MEQNLIFVPREEHHMSFESAIQNIESHEFGATLGIANDPEMFFELARQQNPVAELMKSLADKSNQKRLVLRVISVLRQREDLRFRNSRDAALAVYLCALECVNKRYAILAATDVISQPRLWWARKAATAVLSRVGHPSMVSHKIVTDSLKKAFLKNRKDVLIVNEPSGDWMRTGNIIDDDQIQVRSDNATEQVHEETSKGQSGFSIRSGRAIQRVGQS
jgi:hypothetical protein